MRIGIWWIPHHIVAPAEHRYSIVTSIGHDVAYRRAGEIASCLRATSYDCEICDDGEEWEMALPHVMVKLEIPLEHNHAIIEKALSSLPYRLKKGWWPLWTCDECG